MTRLSGQLKKFQPLIWKRITPQKAKTLMKFFTPHEDADTYRVVLYVNMNEGNIELYNDDKDEEIETFDIQEIFEEDND